MALICNGEIKAAEWAKLHETQAREQLGLSSEQWHDIVDGLCEDLLATACMGTSCLMDRRTMARWFGEVDDPELQRLVIRLSAALMGADGRLDAGESAMLRIAIEHWVVPGEEQARIGQWLYGLDFQVRSRPAASN